jgi:DNA-directed RNA polymerase subunit alpha
MFSGQQAEGGAVEKAEVPLLSLGLSICLFNCFRRNKTTKVGDLLDKRERYLLVMRKFGKKSLEELKERLLDNRLSLQQDDGQS